jgi:hypothetical protein
MTGIPDHLHRELDALGVRMPPRAAPRPKMPPPVDPWWKRNEECPH